MKASKFKKYGLILGVFLIIGVIAYSQKNLNNTHEKEIQKAEDFSLLDRSGRLHQFSSISDEYKILHFWASWCEPCIEEIPKLFNFINRFNDKSLTLVLVSLDENWPKAMSVLSKFKVPKKAVSLLDPTTKVAEVYGSYQFPESFLINGKQEIVKKWVGPQDWSMKFIKELFH